MDTDQLAKIAKALADPTRLRIYGHIASSGEIFCGELIERERIAPGTVSHHLKVLAEAGLIESRREGQFIYNRPQCDALARFTKGLAKLTRSPKAEKKYSADSRRLFATSRSQSLPKRLDKSAVK